MEGITWLTHKFVMYGLFYKSVFNFDKQFASLDVGKKFSYLFQWLLLFLLFGISFLPHKAFGSLMNII